MHTFTRNLMFLFVGLALFSCSDFAVVTINGEGEVVTKEFELDEFSKIHLANGWNVKLIPSKVNKIEARVNQNLVEFIDFKIEDETLELRSERTIKKADSKQIDIYFSGNLSEIVSTSGISLTAADIIGAAKLDLKLTSGTQVKLTLEAQELNVKATSGAQVTLAGVAEKAELKSTSGSSLETEGLRCFRLKAKSTSGGYLSLTAVDFLEAKSTSGGLIKHNKSVKEITTETTSGGNIKPRE
ncbi:MAG: GIN domain-containing protein [Bacteroidota bacterium]